LIGGCGHSIDSQLNSSFKSFDDSTKRLLEGGECLYDRTLKTPHDIDVESDPLKKVNTTQEKSVTATSSRTGFFEKKKNDLRPSKNTENSNEADDTPAEHNEGGARKKSRYEKK